MGVLTVLVHTCETFQVFVYTFVLHQQSHCKSLSAAIFSMANNNRLSLKSINKRNQEAMSHSQMNAWINGMCVCSGWLGMQKYIFF